MNNKNLEKPDYGNWVSLKLISVPGIVGLVFLSLAFHFPFLTVIAAPFILIAAYFAYARTMFSPRGGNIQNRIRELLLENLDWDGEGQAIDIGCGNAPLAIQLAQKYPKA